MQNADGDFGVGDREPGGVDRGGPPAPRRRRAAASNDSAGSAAMPISSLRRNGDNSPCFFSSDICNPSLFEDALWTLRRLPKFRWAGIRKIAYVAPQDHDVGFACCRTWGHRETRVAGRQRIVRVRRQYNQWVANQTLEDYALRFTAKSARQWSVRPRGATRRSAPISFLACEAIGGAITLTYGFTNAAAAILVVGVIIFLIGLPIAYYAAATASTSTC